MVISNIANYEENYDNQLKYSMQRLKVCGIGFQAAPCV